VTAVDSLPEIVSSPKQSLREWRLQVLNWVLYGLAFLGVLAVIGEARLRLEDGRNGFTIFYILMQSGTVLAACVHRLGFVPRAVILVSALYASAIGGYLLSGIVNVAPPFLFAAVIMSTLFLGLRWGVGVLVLSVATMGGMGVAFTLGWLEAPWIPPEGSPDLWFTYSAIFVALGAATVASIWFLIRRLEGSLETSVDLIHSLEQRFREQERAEQAMQASEARLLEAQRVGRIGSFEWGVRERNAWWSDEMYRVLGREAGAERPRFAALLQEIHPEDRARIAEGARAWLSGEGPSSLEGRIVLKDGSIRHLRAEARLDRGADGKPERAAGTVQDITEARELEQQLRQSQKLETVGQLAGGVAHDFNNLLTVITGYGASLAENLEGEAREAAREICLAAERASALTRQLLAFSRRQVLEPRILDLNGVVRELDGMLRRLIGEEVSCELLLDPSLGRVMADPGQMQQVVLNLVLNARDAMPQGGKLTIRTHEVDCSGDACHLLRHPGGKLTLQTYEVDSPPEGTGIALGSDPVGCVCLSVTDDGCGMDPETQARIFEPFFTTKGAGGGTGLGLSTVYGIVKQSDGGIRVESSPGRGTTVELYLPRVDGSEERAPVESSAPETEHRGSERILLVEDQESVRRMTRKALESRGYRVLEAREGAEALAIARGSPGDLDLVVTDVVMPRMGGIELAMQLREEWPNMRVLFVSGHPRHASWTETALPAGAAFLEKPFGPREIAKKVRETLDA
jgi:signal transduction histidine kinase